MIASQRSFSSDSTFSLSDICPLQTMLVTIKKKNASSFFIVVICRKGKKKNEYELL
jgi:hypothetical protein